MQSLGYLGTENVSHLTINGEAVEVVKEFVYLGSVISSNTSNRHEADINRRKAIAIRTMKSLSKVWQMNVSTQLKMRLYDSLILSILLYGSETWALTETQKRKILGFENRALRKILNIDFRQHIRNSQGRSSLKTAKFVRSANNRTSSLQSCAADSDILVIYQERKNCLIKLLFAKRL